MILIDSLIHRFHWELGTTAKAAKNPIGGKGEDLFDFLEHLAYGDVNTPELKATREKWATIKRESRNVHLKSREEMRKGAQEKAKSKALKRQIQQQMLSERTKPS